MIHHNGPFIILDSIQRILNQLQNLLIAYMTTIDMEINTLCNVIVTSHKEAIVMKEMLELFIAMLELAGSKLSKSQVT